jgi:hypothetical protein
MLKFAFDRHRRLIPSGKAEHGVDYYCPCCGVIVRLKVSKNGVPFYFCLRGTHGEPDCAEFAERLSDYATDDINVRTIMLNMIRVPGPQGPHGPAAGLTTMRLLWMAGIPFAEPDMPVHGGVLADFLIGPRAFAQYLADGSDIGQRIIVAKPDRPLSGHRIRFLCDWPIDENSKTPDFKKYFVVQFDTAKDFWYYCNQMIDQRKTDGETLWCPKFEWVMLAGDWHAVDKAECKKTCYKCQRVANCYGMQYAEFHSRNQIYIPDTRQNRLGAE